MITSKIKVEKMLASPSLGDARLIKYCLSSTYVSPLRWALKVRRGQIGKIAGDAWDQKWPNRKAFEDLADMYLQ